MKITFKATTSTGRIVDNVLTVKMRVPCVFLCVVSVLFLSLHESTLVGSTVSLSLSHWYPGSGVVLDCIDS